MKRFAMRFFPIAACILLACPADASANSHFKDWEVACDNLRFCTAIGGPGNDGDGFIRITRGGDIDAPPSILIAVGANGVVGSPVRLSLDSPDAIVIQTPPLTQQPGEYPNATLSGADAQRLIGAMRVATHITIEPVKVAQNTSALSQPHAPVSLSLSGSVAALTFMDDRQKRGGTTSALLAKGSKAGNKAMFMPPTETSSPEWRVEPMQVQVQKAAISQIPQSLISRKEFKTCGHRLPPLSAHLSSGAILWGICVDSAAYNQSYAFFIVNHGTITNAAFELPPNLSSKARKSNNVLTNPVFSADGIVLSETALARGVGDAGEMSQWVWDGSRFRLLSYREMENLWGVSPTWWPTLYQAKMKMPGAEPSVFPVPQT